MVYDKPWWNLSREQRVRYLAWGLARRGKGSSGMTTTAATAIEHDALAAPAAPAEDNYDAGAMAYLEGAF